MADRPRVTITLGRSGQVVKRTRSISDGLGISSSDGNHPVRERLSMADSNFFGSQHKNKRLRTESHSSSSSDYNQNKQIRTNRQIGRNDLRFKLINKSFFRKGQNGREGQNGVDLREKLSRNREIYLKSDRKQNLRDSRTSGSARRLPPTRSADDLLQLDMLRKPYPSRAMDERRHRSPDRLFSSSRVLSSRRSYEDLPHGPSIRSIEASGHSSFIKNGLVDSSRTIPFMSKTRLPIDTGKSVVRDPQSGRITQRSTLTPEEPLTVSSLLKTLGLGKYAIMFQAEEIDMTALRQMGDRDLKELGIPMGPRKKILLAALSQSKQRY